MTHKPALKFSSMSNIISLQVRWTGEFDNSFRFFRIHLWVETSIFPLKRKIVADYPKYSEPRKSSKVSDWWTRKEIQSFELRIMKGVILKVPHWNSHNLWIISTRVPDNWRIRNLEYKLNVQFLTSGPFSRFQFRTRMVFLDLSRQVLNTS